MATTWVEGTTSVGMVTFPAWTLQLDNGYHSGYFKVFIFKPDHPKSERDFWVPVINGVTLLSKKFPDTKEGIRAAQRFAEQTAADVITRTLAQLR